MRIFRPIIIMMLCLMCAGASFAGRTMVSAKLDSVTILMGSKVPMKLEVVKDKDEQGGFPQLINLSDRGAILALLNDTVEISQIGRPDTTEIGTGRIQINYNLAVQVFDSGYYRIPVPFYISGTDTVRASDIFLKVNPVKVTAEDKISPMGGVLPPENPSFFDELPDWLVNWWWVALAAAALAVAGIWLWRRYRTTGSILPPKPETPPHIVALDRLKVLKSRHLWENGQEKEFYTLLTDILRIYLDKRFGIKAMEMTSREINDVLTDNPELRLSRPMMRQILDMADFVKFAKVRPLPDDNVRAFDNAVAFVEETAPKPEPVASVSEEDVDSAVKTSADKNKDAEKRVSKTGKGGDA